MQIQPLSAGCPSWGACSCCVFLKCFSVRQPNARRSAAVKRRSSRSEVRISRRVLWSWWGNALDRYVGAPAPWSFDDEVARRCSPSRNELDDLQGSPASCGSYNRTPGKSSTERRPAFGCLWKRWFSVCVVVTRSSLIVGVDSVLANLL